jgi:hypothetical protein
MPLSDRAQFLRADRGRDARPVDHPPGAGFAERAGPPLPNTRYASDARLKVDLVRDHLAGKEMEVGRFYQRRGQWLAAVQRFRS